MIEEAIARLGSVDLLAVTANSAAPGAVAELVQTMHDRLAELSDALTHRYFAHADARVS